MWISGKMPAQATAKSVIASANRLMDVRQSCLNSSRIAEISVPAWPMPIHQTKLMMAKPQPMGMLTPQIPVPFRSSQVIDINSIIDSMKPTARPKNQLYGCRRVRTIADTCSVTEANVCPGSMTGCGA